MESEYSFFTKNQDDIIKISRMLHVKGLFTLCKGFIYSLHAG